MHERRRDSRVRAGTVQLRIVSRVAVVYVCGDRDVQRRVFSEEGRGYWPAALPLVLEKHGYLDFTVREPDALEDGALWRAGQLVLVGRLPDECWTEAAVDRLLAARAGVLLEGPPPAKLARALALEDRGPAPRHGLVTVTDRPLHAAALAFGYPPGGRVQSPTGRPLSRNAELHWSRAPDVPVSESLAQAWARSGWDVSRWELPNGYVKLADWLTTDREERWPAIVQRDRLIACSFGLFGFLGQQHTSEPFGAAEHRSSPRSLGLETMLLALIDRLHAAVGATRTRVLPWPEGVRWVRSVRHDFDRVLNAARVGSMLRRHASSGTRATWYWRGRHAGLEGLRMVGAEERHEVALHTEQVWHAPADERERVESAIVRRVKGTSAHGAPDSFGFQGAPNVLWAEAEQLSYTECIQHAHLHPHRFASLAPDGQILPLQVLCLPHHESFDRSTRPGDTLADRIRQAPDMWAAAGGFLQVMNHPDLNEIELFDVLDSMPSEGRADWTAASVADWWRRSHVAHQLLVGSRDDGTVAVRSIDGVSDAVVEVRTHDGDVSLVPIELEPGGEHVIKLAGQHAES